MFEIGKSGRGPIDFIVKYSSVVECVLWIRPVTMIV